MAESSAAGVRPDPSRLRVALTLPGAVSLGSYHGGALAALLLAARHSEGRLVVDTMATASAGSITGVLAARALLRGADPVALMSRSWVEGDSLQELRSRDTASVLSAEPLRELAVDLLDPEGSIPDGGPDVPRQQEPIRISMSLASLGGLAYRLPIIDEDQPGFDALTHVDWFSARFAPDRGDDQFDGAVQAALASAANALGFAPVLLDRSADRDTYRRNHIIGVPDDGPWPVWYTDGGTVDNEPFGRALDLVGEAEAAGELTDGADRLFLLVEPLPGAVDRVGRWWDPDHEPHWTFTLFDVFNLRGDQTIYDDLRRLEKTNSRVRWTEAAVSAVSAALADALDAVPTDRRDEVETAVAAHLTDALDDMAADRRRLAGDQRVAGDAGADQPSGASPPAGADLRDLLELLVMRSAGLHGKRPARVEMVSPLLDGDGPPVSDRLAGDFLFHFGGFVDEAFRRHDFLVGWSNMCTWLQSRADALALGPALDEVDARREALGWTLAPLNPSLRGLDWGQKWLLSRTAGHVGHVIAHDLLDLLEGG